MLALVALSVTGCAVPLDRLQPSYIVSDWCEGAYVHEKGLGGVIKDKVDEIRETKVPSYSGSGGESYSNGAYSLDTVGIGFEIGKRMSDRTGVGVRAGQLNILETANSLHVNKMGRSITGETVIDISGNWELAGSVNSVLIGGWLQLGALNGGHLRLIAYGGPVLATVNLKQDYYEEITPQPRKTMDYSADLWGLGFGYELALEFNIRLGETSRDEWAFLFFDLGYQGANIPVLLLGNDIDTDGDGAVNEKSGHPYTALNGEKAGLSWGGIRAAAGLKAAFE